jgi:hypothetical protein
VSQNLEKARFTAEARHKPWLLKNEKNRCCKKVEVV